MKSEDWPFQEPQNLAVFTSQSVLEGNDWIHYVTHDADDGAWQFHGYTGPTSEEDARLVGLNTIVSLDSTIVELNDLPLGWCAWRETKESQWQRMEKE